MTVHSNRLGYKLALGTADSTLYTVPANTRTIVKGIQAQNLGGAAAILTLKVWSGATQLYQWDYHLAAVGSSGETITDEVWMVMLAGEHLTAVISAGTATLAVSGSELLTT